MYKKSLITFASWEKDEFDERRESHQKVQQSGEQTAVLCLFLLNCHNLCHSFRFSSRMMNRPSLVLVEVCALPSRMYACAPLAYIYIYIWIGPTLSPPSSVMARLFVCHDGFYAGNKPFRAGLYGTLLRWTWVNTARNHHAGVPVRIPRW